MMSTDTSPYPGGQHTPAGHREGADSAAELPWREALPAAQQPRRDRWDNA